MRKQFDGVKAEKAEAMRRYNNQKRFRSIVRAAAVAFFCYLWFPTVAVSLQAAGGWFHRAGAVIVTNRAFVFFFVNTLVALIFLSSRDGAGEESASVRSAAEPDLYDEYTSSFSFSAVTVAVTASDGDDSEKQIVPTLIAEAEEEVVAEKQIVPAEEVVVEAAKGDYRRTRSERKKKVKREVKEFRRTESANSGIERLSSEEFRLKIEAFIMEKKRSLVQEENDVVAWQEHCSSGLELVGAADSC
ncbi:Transmembrane protein [Hirschfeldia incana]|nr:Transmembrane protein [Hirschfeldia incana]